MHRPDYHAFFKGYADVLIAALAGDGTTDQIRSHFAEYLVGAGPGDFVNGLANDDHLAGMLEKNQSFYKDIRLTRMQVTGVDAVPIDELHDTVRVDYNAGYKRKGGSDVSTDFSITYMLQRRDKGPRIFAFVTGDEMALYKDLGLIGADGKPI